MSPGHELSRLEKRLHFYTPCFENSEIAQVLGLVRLFTDLRIVMRHVQYQRALFPNQTAILDVLQAEYENQENGEKATPQSIEENPYTRSRRLLQEAKDKEAFRAKVGKDDWQKAKAVINNFQGRIIAVTQNFNQGEIAIQAQGEAATFEKIREAHDIEVFNHLDKKAREATDQIKRKGEASRQNRSPKPQDRTRRKKAPR